MNVHSPSAHHLLHHQLIHSGKQIVDILFMCLKPTLFQS